MKLKIKKLLSTAFTPTYGTEGAACFDLYADQQALIQPGQAKTIDTSLAFEVPEGWVMRLYGRSGRGFKPGIRLANTAGIVDSDYRGLVPVRLHNDSVFTFIVNRGDRIAQAMLAPVPRIEFEEVDELSDTARGEGGFGSTGA